jgi:hypothetical protein
LIDFLLLLAAKAKSFMDLSQRWVIIG